MVCEIRIILWKNARGPCKALLPCKKEKLFSTAKKITKLFGQFKKKHYLCTVFSKTDIKKAFIDACFGNLKSGKFLQPKARWFSNCPVDMYKSTLIWRTMHIGVGVIVYSCWKGITRTSDLRISGDKVPRFVYSHGSLRNPTPMKTYYIYV